MKSVLIFAVAFGCVAVAALAAFNTPEAGQRRTSKKRNVSLVRTRGLLPAPVSMAEGYTAHGELADDPFVAWLRGDPPSVRVGQRLGELERAFAIEKPH